MKTFYFVVILSGLLLAGCGPSAEQLTATAVMAKAQTQTAAPTFTPTLTSTVTLTPTATVTVTRTPKPTATATSTPAAVGEAVKFANLPLEVTVLWSQTHTHIVPGGKFYYYAEKGRMFVELGVLVRNTDTKPLKFNLEDIFVTGADKRNHRPGFAAWKTVDIDKQYDPSVLPIPKDPNKDGEEVTFEKDTYLRLIFYVTSEEKFIFRILNSPLIAFEVKK